MGLFGFGKKMTTCVACGEETEVESYKKLTDGGYICQKCFLMSRYPKEVIYKKTSEEMKDRIKELERRKEDLKTFQTTTRIDKFLCVDEKNKRWFVPDGPLGKAEYPLIHKFSDVVEFELLEDGGTITSGGVGRAVAGAALFGGVGAVVGGVTGGKKSKAVCYSLQLKITLNTLENPTEYITFIKGETKSKDPIYRERYESAHKCLSMFQIIVDMCEKENSTTSSPQLIDVAGEIKKFKELLDMGAITQEEFDAKKKQLLGI